jgi:UDP-N-acetylmuramate--alanine ligase
MHIFFSGIGGAGIGPLSLIAHEAGYTVSGSDKQDSAYIDYLKDHGVSDIHIGQSLEAIAAIHAKQAIDWYVYSSALEKENPNHPELTFVKNNSIKHSKRDEFINGLMQDKQLALLAIAGTHGKTTTTAMLVWLFKQLGLPVSYSVGAKLSYGEMGEFSTESAHFVYECDEYDRNFLQFRPKIALISGIDYDHPDIYPTRDAYYEAFRLFISQSFHTIMWRSDAEKLGLQNSETIQIIEDADARLEQLHIAGHVNRKNALLVAELMAFERGVSVEDAIPLLNNFPGISRRFEVLIPGLVTDYAHTPKKIEGALQLAHEVAGENVVVVYEGLHNTRQHFIKDDLAHLFDSAKKFYVVPSYLAREDESLSMLSPRDIVQLTSKASVGVASELNETLKNAILQEIADGNLVVCFSAGGGGSLDEWLREELIHQTNE